MPKYEMKMWDGSAYVDVPIGGGGANASRYTAVLASGSWVSSNGAFTQSVTINGIKSDDTPLISMVGSYIPADNKVLAAEWSKVYNTETFSNSIKFYAYEALSEDISLQIMNISVGESSAQEAALTSLIEKEFIFASGWNAVDTDKFNGASVIGNKVFISFNITGGNATSNSIITAYPADLPKIINTPVDLIVLKDNGDGTYSDFNGRVIVDTDGNIKFKDVQETTTTGLKLAVSGEFVIAWQ